VPNEFTPIESSTTNDHGPTGSPEICEGIGTRESERDKNIPEEMPGPRKEGPRPGASEEKSRPKLAKWK